jgi:hypothetical protein
MSFNFSTRKVEWEGDGLRGEWKRLEEMVLVLVLVLLVVVVAATGTGWTEEEAEVETEDGERARGGRGGVVVAAVVGGLWSVVVLDMEGTSTEEEVSELDKLLGRIGDISAAEYSDSDSDSEVIAGVGVMMTGSATRTDDDEGEGKDERTGGDGDEGAGEEYAERGTEIDWRLSTESDGDEDRFAGEWGIETAEEMELSVDDVEAREGGRGDETFVDAAAVSLWSLRLRFAAFVAPEETLRRWHSALTWIDRVRIGWDWKHSDTRA